MSIYITIDGGTTYTRINLAKDRKIIASIKLDTGAYSNIENGDLLKNKIKEAIDELLKSNSLKETDIVRILASGMITSEFGLCNLSHIEAPAGISELSSSAEEIHIKEISSIPFVFIRGVKIKSDSFENCDIMRGEETELMGIINKDYDKCVYILPGSHTKLIMTDNQGRITNFQTMLTGEMIKALSQNTILKDAVELGGLQINTSYLLKGYDYCLDEGINKALFKVRILKNVFSCTKEEIYSFFMGVILCGEIDNIKNSDAKTVVIGGRAQMKNALSSILNERTDKRVITLSEEAVNASTVVGAIRIFENDIL